MDDARTGNILRLGPFLSVRERNDYILKCTVSKKVIVLSVPGSQSAE